jgi:8-oxo-dGTP pyrophosphatase MutT (NUDIX family)
MTAEIPLDESDLEILDEIQDFYGGDQEQIDTLSDMLQNAKGKPCGDSHISEDETCHIGEVKKQKALRLDQIDLGAAKLAYKSMKGVEEDPTGLREVDHAVNALHKMPNAGDFKSRVKIYDLDKEYLTEVQKGIADQKWPDHPAIKETLDAIQDGEVDGHSFLTVGKYGVDPVLEKKGVPHDLVNDFCHTMGKVYYSAFIDPTTLPGIKGKASTSDILGVSVPGKEDDDHPFHEYLKDKYKPFEKAKSAGIVVFNDEGKVLIVKPKDKFGGHEWTLSKGRIDQGETDEQAAHRELSEETGVKAHPPIADLGWHVGSITNTHFFLSKHKEGDPAPNDKEMEEVKWMTPDEAADKLDSVRDLRVLAKAMAAIHNQK